MLYLFQRLLPGICMVLLLAVYGCGGSSSQPSTDGMTGDSDGMPTFGMPGFIDPRIEADDWRHDHAANARAETGGQDPMLSSSGHDAKVRQIAADSDTTIQLSFWNPGNGVWEQSDPNCSGTTCDWNDPDNEPLTKENVIPAQELLTILPVMNRRGTEIHLSEFSGANSLGPWGAAAFAGVLDHSFFGTNYLEWDSGEASSNRFVWGAATGSNPAMGSATWSGIMVGSATSISDSFWVQGDADVTVHFGSGTTLDVAFSGVVEIEGGGERFTIDPWMSVPVANGSYQSGTNFGDEGDRYLEGQFFGPNAEETAGVFYDWVNSDPNYYFEGAFGATRDSQ